MALSEEILKELKGKLIIEKERLKKELRKIAQPVDDDEYKTIYEDIGEEKDENATEVQMYANRLAVKEDLERQLKDVENALKKIEEHKYGICEKCGKEIEIERLKAYPAAKTCIRCARENQGE